MKRRWYTETTRSGRWSGVVASCVILLGCSELSAGFVTKSNTTTGFADASVLTRNITFSAADFADNYFTIGDLDVTISFAKSNNDSFAPQASPINPGFPYFSEIDFLLTSPSGTSVKLISNVGGSRSFRRGNDGFQGTLVFDQSAALPVNFDVDNITAGTYRPAAESLDAFNGENVTGTWTLTIGDSVARDGLSFYSYSLSVYTLPEPDSIGLWGAFLMVSLLVLVHRQRRSLPLLQAA